MRAGLQPLQAWLLNQQKIAPILFYFLKFLFEEEKFLKRVDQCVKKYGYCTIVVSEGVHDKEGKFLSDTGLRDAFGHAQLGGVAPVVAQMISNKFGYKYHWAVSDYLQRAARHIASKTDVDQAYALGKAAVEFALKGKNAVMPIVVRKTGKNMAGKLVKRSCRQWRTLKKQCRAITLPKMALISRKNAVNILNR